MIVYYHKNCNDGSAAALAAWLAHPDATFIAVNYGTDPSPDDYRNEHVYILDFSWPASTITLMAEDAYSITILDHHKTAEMELAQLQLHNVMVTFDMTQSGAMLAWKHFHPNKGVPELIRNIQDRDIWTREMPWSDHISRALMLHRDWRQWAPYLDNTSQLIHEGSVLLEAQNLHIQSLIAHLKPSVLEVYNRDGVRSQYFDIPIINVPAFMISDTLHALLQKFPEASFAAGFNIVEYPNVYQWSLRSSDDREDVALIARNMGGGGHRNAAGFRSRFLHGRHAPV